VRTPPPPRLAQARRVPARSRHPGRGAGALKSEPEIRAALRGWILEHSRNGHAGALDDDTPILERGFLSSLDVVELILFIESLRGSEVDEDSIQPEALINIDTLYQSFFPSDRA
jgi:acyl carrier protein